MADNKVKVKIYGQEYTIAGERDEETIREIAAYVDSKMKEVAQLSTQYGLGSVPVLAAINIADDYFQNRTDVTGLKDKVSQLERDCDNYLRMWEEAKRSFIQYKDGASKYSAELDALEKRIKELEAKCNEYENSYFDSQVENLKLKTQIEKLQRGDY